MIEDRGEALRALAERLGDKPPEWGVDDCSMMVAQWIADATGRDFDWPRYDSAEDANALIAAHGSLAALWTAILAPAGICELHLAADEIPAIGDVGIVSTRHVGDVGGIFLHGGNFMWRSERVTIFPPRRHTIVKVWRV